MRVRPMVCAALLGALIPAGAFADDPHDPAMKDSAARARDRAIVRRLNMHEDATTRARDARYAQGWQANRQYNRQDMATYQQSRSNYDQAMAEWRRAVAACRSGDYSACQQ